MPNQKTCGNNDECDECLEDQLPVWDGSIPQGQMCQRPDGYARENLDTCGNEAQVGMPYGHLDEEAIENDSDTFSSVGFHYYCEECAAEFKAEEEMMVAYFKVVENMFPEHAPACIGEPNISRLMNGQVTIDELVSAFITWILNEEGELEEAGTVLSRLIDPKGGEK